MTERDGSKARASAICIRRGHLLWSAGVLPEKMALDCSFPLQNPVDLIRGLGEDARPLSGRFAEGMRDGEEKS
ncbi:MAG: hypothetical protein WA303_03820 [Bradyrhizobium sp.]|jgi:hypothetical protein